MFFHFGKQWMSVYEGEGLQNQINRFGVEVMTCMRAIEYDHQDEPDYSPITFNQWKELNERNISAE
jgi:hypothetical protein